MTRRLGILQLLALGVLLASCAPRVLELEAKTSILKDRRTGFHAYLTALEPVEKSQIIITVAPVDSITGRVEIHTPDAQIAHRAAIFSKNHVVHPDELEALLASRGIPTALPPDVKLVRLGRFERELRRMRPQLTNEPSPVEDLKWASMGGSLREGVSSAIDDLCSFAATYGGQAIVDLSVVQTFGTPAGTFLYASLVAYDYGGSADKK